MSGKAYGAIREWSTVNAPHPFAGICENYSRTDAYQENLIEGETDIEAVVLDQRKGEISFEATVTDATINFLDLSDGVKIAVSGLAGVVLVRECVERWALRTPKRASLSANHYPAMVDADGAAVTVNVDAMTPSEQAGVIIRPGGKVVWSTVGLTHTAGIIQNMVLTQRVKIEEDTDEVGKIVAAFVSHYMRTLELTLTSMGTKPEPDTVLVISGAPANAGGYVIRSADERYAKGAVKTYQLSATWVPGAVVEDDGEPE